MTASNSSFLKKTLGKSATITMGTTLAVASVLGLGIAPATAAQQDIVNQSSAQSQIYLRQSLLEGINQYRASKGLNGVEYSYRISGIAQERSNRAAATENLTAGRYYADDRAGEAAHGAEAFLVTRQEYGDLDDNTTDENVRFSTDLTWRLLHSPESLAVLDNPDVQAIGVGVTEVPGRLSITGQEATMIVVVDAVSYTAHSSRDVTSVVQATAPYAGGGSSAGKDVSEEHPYYADILKVRQAGILNGWSDGTFKPDAVMERGGAAAAAYRMAGSPAYTAPKTSAFKDVTPTTDFYKEIHWAKSKGILNGYSDGTFRPGAPMERFATAALFYRLAGSPAYTAPTTPAFRDVQPGAAFYKEIHWMESQDIANGWFDGTYRSSSGITRGAMAAYVTRYMDY